MKSNYYPYSNLKNQDYNRSKYSENKRSLNGSKVNNINNNVFNLNSYQINSSPKIYKYSFKNNKENSPYNSKRTKREEQMDNRNSKFTQGNTYMKRRNISSLNSIQDNLNNSLNKVRSRYNKSLQHFHPIMNERYNTNKNSKIYHDNEFNNSLNNSNYNNHFHKSPSV